MVPRESLGKGIVILGLASLVGCEDAVQSSHRQSEQQRQENKEVMSFLTKYESQFARVKYAQGVALEIWTHSSQKELAIYTQAVVLANGDAQKVKEAQAGARLLWANSSAEELAQYTVALVLEMEKPEKK